jgi:orotidine-5'-phosphate decarboxylase
VLPTVAAQISAQGAPLAGSRTLSAQKRVEGFGERLASRVSERGSQLVLGLDPDPARLWPSAVELAGRADAPAAPPASRAAHAVAYHCPRAIEAAGEHCVAVKLQVACFERLGAPGWGRWERSRGVRETMTCS